MTPEQFIDRLKRLQVLRGKLPGQVGEMARSFFLDNYRKGGFEDQTFVPWVERKPVPAGKTDKNKGRALLVKSGKLRRSIRVMEKGEGYVIIGSDVKYARFHNDGVEGRLPQRQFIGPSKALNVIVEKKIISDVIKALS